MDFMDFAPVYLVERLGYQIWNFFHHWYWHGSRVFGDRYMASLRAMDETFAVGITLRHFFEPLYRDYSVIGRILGIIFRTCRVVIGGAIYVAFSIFFAAVYLVWLAVPLVIIFTIIHDSL